MWFDKFSNYKYGESFSRIALSAANLVSLLYHAFHHCNTHLCGAKTYLQVLGRIDQIHQHYKYPSACTFSKLLVNKSDSTWLSFLALQRSLLLKEFVKWHAYKVTSLWFHLQVTSLKSLSTHWRLENLLTQHFQQDSGLFLWYHFRWQECCLSAASWIRKKQLHVGLCYHSASTFSKLGIPYRI